MIPLVEDYLSELIQGRFDDLKINPSKIPKILSVSEERANMLSAYLAVTPVKVIKGYPRTPAQLPCICILLSGEQETQDGLGDYGDDSDSTIVTHTEIVNVQFNNAGILSMPYIEVTNKPIDSIASISYVGSGQGLHPEDYYIEDESRGLVAFPSADVDDGEALSITYDYVLSSYSGIRSLWESNYRIEAWTQNGDMTVDLYHLAKYAMMYGRDWLSSVHNIFSQKLSGADFEPAPSYFPEFVYRRALSFWCQFNASVPTTNDDYIQSVDITESFTIDGGA